MGSEAASGSYFLLDTPLGAYVIDTNHTLFLATVYVLSENAFRIQWFLCLRLFKYVYFMMHN